MGVFARFRSGMWRLCLFAAVGMAACAPARALDPSKAFSQYIETNWSDQSGLNQKSVNAVAQTDDGFLWLATEEGLVRYDGLSFVTFDERNAEGLGDRMIRSLAPTAGGGLWIGTSTGLVRYREGRFTDLRVQTKYRNDIYDLALTPDGSVWFSSDTGLRRYAEAGPQPGMELFTTEDGLPSNGITSLVAGSEGGLWVGTRRGLVRYFDGRFVTYGYGFSAKGSPEKMGDITSLALGSDRSVWIGLSNGVIAKWSAGAILPVWQGDSTRGAPVWSLHEDRDGTLWAAFRKTGLGRMRDGRLELLTRANGLPSISPDWIFEDREKNLWVGWVDTGLSMFRDGRFTVYGRSEGLSSDLISTVTTASNGNLWVGTEDGGLNRLAVSKGSSQQEGKAGFAAETMRHGDLTAHSAKGVMALLQQRDGTLWVGGDLGSVTRIQNGRSTLFRVQGPLAPGVRAIVEDAHGEVWFGFEMENGLARLRNGRFEFEHIPGSINGMAVAPDGSLWIASYQGGLVHYANGVLRMYTQADGLSNLALTSVYVGPDGTVWAGTMLGGLNRLKDGHITRYSIDQGLSDSTVGGIVADLDGSLWLAGTRGIMRVALSDLDAYAAGKIIKVNTRTFSYADGLRSSECSFKAQPTAVRDTSGRLWFATLSGIAMIDPRHMRRDEAAPVPLIEGISASGHALAVVPDEMEIDPRQRDISIRFAAPTFIAPEQLRLHYRLLGFDGKWVAGDPRQRVRWTNLAPGHYVFEVQTADANGAVARIAFEIFPHFYETWWFRILMAAVAVLAIGYCLRLRTRILLRKNQELERLILDKTAEVRLALESAEKSREMLREQALRDALTGLWNRRAIFEILDTQIQQCAAANRPLNILMADIDHFKSINDTWGHQAGDEVIREVSRRLRQGVREGDAVGRYGGEELLILLPGAPLELALERAERLREDVCRLPVDVGGWSIKVSCSFGLTCIQPGLSMTEMVGQADAALYQAKKEGRNCVRLSLPMVAAQA